MRLYRVLPPPHPVIVTTRITRSLVGNPYKPLFATVAGLGGRSKVYWHCKPIVSLVMPHTLLRTWVDSLEGKTIGNFHFTRVIFPQMRETSWTCNIRQCIAYWNLLTIMVWKVCGHIVHGSLIKVVGGYSSGRRFLKCALWVIQSSNRTRT